jgi:16S rRNA (uracil1498-N3)-methyltransferase
MDFGCNKKMRRFYTLPENFSQTNVILDLEETRHLRDVLRLKITEKVRVFDGLGKEFICEIEEISKKLSKLKILNEISPISPESNLDLTLAVALLKGDKLDLVVQKAVELGVTQIIPLSTFRCDVKSIRLDRLQRICLEATKQCGRAKLMQIVSCNEFREFVQNTKGNNLLFSEAGGKSLSSIKLPNKINELTAIIGPEGGWEDSELEIARNNDIQIITLGGRILRAETASISIASVLQHKFGDFI